MRAAFILAAAAALVAASASASPLRRARATAASAHDRLATLLRRLPPHPVGADAYYPPFSASPNISLVSLQGGGGYVTFPVPGAPTVFYIYNRSSPACVAWWSDVRGMQGFLNGTLAAWGDDLAAYPRFVFVSSSSDPIDLMGDIILMSEGLAQGMTALNWTDVDVVAWMALTSFSLQAAAPGDPGLGWLADMAANWTASGAFTTLGGALELRTSPAHADAALAVLRMPRLDSAAGWLPPPPADGTSMRMVYGGDALAMLPGSVAALPGCENGATPACAVLVTCGYTLPSPGTRCGNWTRVVAAAQAAGAAAVVVVQASGVPPVYMDCLGADECATAGSLAVPATLVRNEEGAAMWAALGSPPPLTPPPLATTLVFQDTADTPGFSFSITAGGTLLETGWPGGDLRAVSWAAQWLDHERRVQANLTSDAARGAVTLRADGGLLSWGDASGDRSRAAAAAPSPVGAVSTVVIPVWNHTLMQGYPGASAVVVVPDAPTLGGLLGPADAAAGAAWTGLALDLSLRCPTEWDASCAPWDRQMQVNVCCTGNQTDPTCGGTNIELARYITPFRRGAGHWFTDVSPLLPLLLAADGGGQSCTFTVSTDAWAKPWYTTLNLRFQRNATAGAGPAPAAAAAAAGSIRGAVAPIAAPASAAAAPLAPRVTLSLWNSGGGNGGVNWGVVFDEHYEAAFPPRTLSAPAWATRAVISGVITGHGSDNNNCAEFCVTTHTITLHGAPRPYVETFDNAGTDEGCTDYVLSGALPNEAGTWLYGRDGWCDGSAVRPWLIDVTADVWGPGVSPSNFTLSYNATFQGGVPHPTPQPNMPYMIVHVYLTFY